MMLDFKSDESDVKRRIREVSSELFKVKGTKAVGMDIIAQECGISKKTLYEYFSSKEELVEYCVHWVMNGLNEFWEGIVQQISDPEKSDFTQVFHYFMQRLKLVISSISHPFIYDLKRYYPQMWNELVEYKRKKVEKYFDFLFKKGQEFEFIRNDIDPKLAFYIHFYTMDNIFTPEILSEISLSAEEIFNNIFKIFFTGLLTKKGLEASAIYKQTLQTQD